jgi:RNA polymerase sigma factor (sigma-70 family)
VTQDTPDPDRYLIEALAFEKELRARLYRCTRNNSDVDELLQEVYARLVKAGASTEAEVRSVRGLAHTTARNVALDWLRHKQVVPIELAADLETLGVRDESAQPEDLVNEEQELQVTLRAAQSLPERRRQVFTLRVIYEFSYAQIAQRLSISESTVKDHLGLAARHLANQMFARMPRPDPTDGPPDAAPVKEKPP